MPPITRKVLYVFLVFVICFNLAGIAGKESIAKSFAILSVLSSGLAIASYVKRA